MRDLSRKTSILKYKKLSEETKVDGLSVPAPTPQEGRKRPKLDGLAAPTAQAPQDVREVDSIDPPTENQTKDAPQTNK